MSYAGISRVMSFLQVADTERSVILETNWKHPSLTTESESNAVNIGHLETIVGKPEKHAEFNQILY